MSPIRKLPLTTNVTTTGKLPIVQKREVNTMSVVFEETEIPQRSGGAGRPKSENPYLEAVATAVQSGRALKFKLPNVEKDVNVAKRLLSEAGNAMEPPVTVNKQITETDKGKSVTIVFWTAEKRQYNRKTEK